MLQPWFCRASAAADEAEKDQVAPAAPDAVAANQSAPSPGELALSQEQVERKYRRFEQVLLRMSELTSASDPKRAALLRKAVARSKDKEINAQFAQLVDLLKRDQLAGAASRQQAVEQDLAQLLELLLSEQRGERLKNERERIKQQIQRVNELIKKQQQLQGQTESGGDAQKLSESEAKLADQTGKLAEEMKDPNESRPAGKPTPGQNGDTDEGREPNEDGSKEQEDTPPKESGDQAEGDGPPEKEQPAKRGDSETPNGDNSAERQQEAKPSKGGQKSSPPQPGESSPPSEASEEQSPPPSDNEVARQRVREARQAMEQARQKLEKAEREGALADQDEARHKLEEAKARLEEILRQLREEEVERTLALLEARFRKMLQMENEVYEGTVRLDRVAAEDRGPNDEIEAGRLGRKQGAVLDELRGAEVLLREDGSSVAFPEAVDELREDMETVSGRLAQAKVDSLTQSTEKDVIAALEEMIAAFQKAQKDQEEQQQRQGQQQAGEPQEPPLVDQLAELRMIRALQMRVNKRTQEYAKLVSGDEGQADQPELLEALEKLSQREARIHRATRDIVLGKNQ